MRTILLAIFALLLTRSHAGTSEACSGVFEFDGRDVSGTTEAVSGVLSVDARDSGNSASSTSSVFTLGTQPGNFDTLVIDASVQARVFAGQPAALPAMASFSGCKGSSVDVSTRVVWSIVGEAPVGTHFDGHKLTGGNVKEPTQIRVTASFSSPSGRIKAAPAKVTILPAQGS